MKPKIIRTEKDHQAALKHIESLMDATPGSPEEEELELWSLLVEEYEEGRFPIDTPDPVEAIKFRMEQEGLRQVDLQKILPHKSKISEVLNRKRSLSLNMIRSLTQGLNIPAAVLVQEPPATYGTSPGKSSTTRTKQGVIRKIASKKALGGKKSPPKQSSNGKSNRRSKQQT